MKASVVTCSNRSAAGLRADESGQLAATALTGAGYEVVSRVVVADDVAQIRAAVTAAVSDGSRIVLTTGGTGLTPTDVTPEAVTPLLDREVPGIAEALRQANRERVPTAILSRGVAGVIGSALVVTLPGSPGGVRDAMQLLLPILDHVLDQIGGGDHRAEGGIDGGGAEPRASRPLAPEIPSTGDPSGTGTVTLCAVSADRLDVEAHRRAVGDEHAGAEVVFCGVVRDHDGGRHVTALEYQAHSSAAEVLAEVATEFASRGDVHAIAVSHRVGKLAIGDVALVAAVSTAHRGEAFATCAALVDEVKRRLPIWKRQIFADGTDEWVNCP